MNDTAQRLYTIFMRLVIAVMELVTNTLHQISYKTNQWAPIAKRKHHAGKTMESIWEDTEGDEDATNILTDEEVRQIIAHKSSK